MQLADGTVEPVDPSPAPVQLTHREILEVLVGLLAMAARKGPLGQAIGLSSLTNGALLGALAVPDLPLLPAIAVVAMAVPFGTVG